MSEFEVKLKGQRIVCHGPPELSGIKVQTGHSNSIPDSVIQAPRITESTKSPESRSRDFSSGVIGIIFRDERDGDHERL